MPRFMTFMRTLTDALGCTNKLCFGNQIWIPKLVFWTSVHNVFEIVNELELNIVGRSIVYTLRKTV